MARLSGNAGLEALRQQQIELAQKIKAAETKAREKIKSDQDRREKLAGRILLAHLAANPHDAASGTVKSILGAALTRLTDRALFDLDASAGGSTTSGNGVERSPPATSHANVKSQET